MCGCTIVGSDSLSVVDIGINGTFSVPLNVPGEWDGEGGPVTLHQYLSVPDCSGSPSSSVTENVNIDATCNLNVPGGWDISCYLDTGFGRIIFFYGSVGNLCSGNVISNSLSCGSTIIGDIATAHGGTATLTY